MFPATWSVPKNCHTGETCFHQIKSFNANKAESFSLIPNTSFQNRNCQPREQNFLKNIFSQWNVKTIVGIFFIFFIFIDPSKTNVSIIQKPVSTNQLTGFHIYWQCKFRSRFRKYIPYISGETGKFKIFQSYRLKKTTCLSIKTAKIKPNMSCN